jgi:hypothetical protein
MLKKKILKFCFIFIMLTPVFALAENTPTQGPAVFLPEEVFEFEPVLEGAEVIHEFAILNQGDELLEILKIQSG